MKLPEEVRNQARDASDLLELVVRDCAKVVMDEIGSTRSEIRDAILARYGLEPK